MLAAILGWAMLCSQLTLPGATPRQEGMPGELVQLRTINNQLLLGDPQRQDLAEVPPGDRILVLAICHEAFAIDGTIDDLRRIIGLSGERDQVRPLLGVPIERAAVRLPMDPYVGDVGQPAAGDFIQMLQGAERTAVEQVCFYIVKGPLYFAFRFRPPGPAGRRPEAVMGSERQEAGIVDRLAMLIAGDDDLHVVVQATGGDSAQVLESMHVLTDRGGEVLTLGEAEILPPRPSQ